MKISKLAAATAFALANASFNAEAVPATAPIFIAPIASGAAMPVITSLGELEVRVKNHQRMLGSDGITTRMSYTAAMFSTPPVNVSDTPVAVVDASALNDEAVRIAAVDLARSKVPVLVLRNESRLMTAEGVAAESRAVSRAFGAASASQAAYYYAAGPASLKIVSFFVAANDGVQPDMMAADQVLVDGLRAARMAAGDVPGKFVIPSLTVTESGSKKGSTSVLEVTVARDRGDSYDHKIVFAKTVSNIEPQYAEFWRLTEENRRKYVFPVEYVSRIRISAPSSPRILRWLPETTGATNINHSSTESRDMSFSIGASPEIQRGLDANSVAGWGQKLPLNAGFSIGKSSSKTITYNFRDYKTAAAIDSDGQLKVFRVSALLADNMRHQPDAPSPITPMMRRAHMETYSEWQLPASSDGQLAVNVANLVNSRYFVKHSGNPEAIDQPDHFPQPSLSIDLRSPFLSASPVVQLKSAVGSGQCLSEKLEAITGVPMVSDSEVDLEVCRQAPHQLWTLDVNQRYVNYNSGKCLEYAGEGALYTKPCSSDNRQRWHWQADRIVSLYNGAADGIRLFNADGLVTTRNDSAVGELPVNGEQTLLSPWSSYPNQPRIGDYVPVLGGVRPSIPVEWATHYGPVSPEQRWEPLPYRL